MTKIVNDHNIKQAMPWPDYLNVDDIAGQVTEIAEKHAETVIKKMVEDGTVCEVCEDGTVSVTIGFLHFKFSPDTFFDGPPRTDVVRESCVAIVEAMDV